MAKLGCNTLFFNDYSRTGPNMFRPYLDKGVFTQLRDRAFFARAYVALDTVCWPNDLDIAPETLYVESVPISKGVHEDAGEYGECP